MIRLFRPDEKQPPYDPQLVEAVERGDAEGVRERLKAGAFVDSCHETGHTCLMIAACHGEREIFELLLEAGADPYLQYAGTCGTALDFAAAGQAEIVEAWLARGLDANLADGVGNTPLMAAAAGGHLEIVRRLLAAGADMNARTVDGITAYSVALHGKHHDVAALLREAGASLDRNDPLMAELVSFESAADEPEFQEVAQQLAEDLGLRHSPGKSMTTSMSSRAPSWSRTGGINCTSRCWGAACTWSTPPTTCSVAPRRCAVSDQG